jgi:hypothetical protein
MSGSDTPDEWNFAQSSRGDVNANPKTSHTLFVHAVAGQKTKMKTASTGRDCQG